MISLVIQAGGQSRRMGEDKALKLFLGRPLIQRVVDRLRPISDEIFVTTNHPEKYAFLGLRLVPDILPGLGTLGGLYTALASASSSIVAVVACDMPFASADLLVQAARILVQEDVDLVIPRTIEGLEPLHAVYRRETCLPVVHSAVESNQLKVIDWFPQVRVREQTPQEVVRIDPSGLTFLNLNTLEEFTRAENQGRDLQ
jgi:molybdopterin-guanine dinucleotide biosynthesis protein A